LDSQVNSSAVLAATCPLIGSAVREVPRTVSGVSLCVVVQSTFIPVWLFSLRVVDAAHSVPSDGGF
jgi:hypothetical protein